MSCVGVVWLNVATVIRAPDAWSDSRYHIKCRTAFGLGHQVDAESLAQVQLAVGAEGQKLHQPPN